MPKQQTKGRKNVFLELPEALVVRLDAEAERQGRSRVGEVMRALERHLAYPEPIPLPTPLPGPSEGVPP